MKNKNALVSNMDLQSIGSKNGRNLYIILMKFWCKNYFQNFQFDLAFQNSWKWETFLKGVFSSSQKPNSQTDFEIFSYLISRQNIFVK